MRAWTVHPPASGHRASVPAAGGEAPRRPLRSGGLLLVPEGFSLLAALVPVLWFPLHRMWLVLVLYLALVVLAVVLLPVELGLYLGVAAQLLIGMHAQDLRRWTLSRCGRPAATVVLGRDEEAALLRALEGCPRWAAAEVGREAMA